MITYLVPMKKHEVLQPLNYKLEKKILVSFSEDSSRIFTIQDGRFCQWTLDDRTSNQGWGFVKSGTIQCKLVREDSLIEDISFQNDDDM